MMDRKGWFAVLPVLALAACGKPLPANKVDYAGEWRAPGLYLLITPDGRVDYERKGSVNKSIDAPIKQFHGNDFEVGIGPVSTTFTVSVPPHPIDAGWAMTVDGVELHRGPNPSSQGT